MINVHIRGRLLCLCRPRLVSRVRRFGSRRGCIWSGTQMPSLDAMRCMQIWAPGIRTPARGHGSAIFCSLLAAAKRNALPMRWVYPLFVVPYPPVCPHLHGPGIARHVDEACHMIMTAAMSRIATMSRHKLRPRPSCPSLSSHPTDVTLLHERRSSCWRSHSWASRPHGRSL